MITPDLIRKLSPRHPNPQAAADALSKAAVRFGITDPESVAAWLANLAIESNLTPCRENLYYTDAARARRIFSALRAYPDSAFVRNPEGMANIVYANRLGNGNVRSGDGWRYRGAGMIQTTGKANFKRTGDLIGLDLVARPELLEQIGPAALAAAAYWTRMSQADALARAGDIRGTRRAVNGPAMLHAAEMLAAYAKALPLVPGAPVQAQPPRVLLVPVGGGQPVVWNGQPTRYGGTDLSAALVEQLRTVYPPGSARAAYERLFVYHQSDGDLVVERQPVTPATIPARPQ
ncbi:glycoside hydrolase family 19 protein [Deinococcus ficus]|uniref:Glycoside hydrolase family 19 catalytic domain-containing protein n=1 Tax=Deinococcus ficus TaxID=317577 RepID=A0A221T200_9DEIO|nr:hypothetical protein [Deinococcus ficus]ASN82937.1 hypothetical protein DFI_17270 [Deinococcus ficus]